MTDEAFHLSPLDVRRWDFGTKAFRGYDEKKVEDFRSQVADELERLTRQAQEFESKARGFHEQLRAFRERDKALNDALVSAQQLRAEMREQAEKEGQLILREARAEGERLIENARAEVRRLEAEVGALEKMRAAYIGQLRAVIERHLAELAAVELPGPTPPPARSSGETEAVEPRPHVKTPAWLESLVKE